MQAGILVSHPMAGCRAVLRVAGVLGRQMAGMLRGDSIERRSAGAHRLGGAHLVPAADQRSHQHQCHRQAGKPVQQAMATDGMQHRRSVSRPLSGSDGGGRCATGCRTPCSARAARTCIARSWAPAAALTRRGRHSGNQHANAGPAGAALTQCSHAPPCPGRQSQFCRCSAPAMRAAHGHALCLRVIPFIPRAHEYRPVRTSG